MAIAQVAPSTRAETGVMSDPVRLVGPLVAVIAIVLTATFNAIQIPASVGAWQAGLALIALAAGIPHGAVDHLTMNRPESVRGWLRYGALYLGVAAGATTLILTFPRVGFLAVVVMTIIHFGSGDASYAASTPGAPRLRRSGLAVRIAAGGSVPIVLPLTHTDATATLTMINPDLLGWLSASTLTGLRWAVITLALVAILILIDVGDLEGAAEFAILLALTLVAPPLVAFAVYFAAWHALRHTARLARLQNDEGEPLPAHAHGMARVAAAGMPALAGLAVIVVVLWPLLTSGRLEGLLWLSLAMVWGLTVPHMTLVARLDKQALSVGTHL
jgi:beta-carotene 15,15'-dioxygenase